MTLTQLEYVLAVDKFKHFGKAAESCFVTQPTLSMQLQKLEDELQVIIFDRSKSPISTTEDGHIVVEQAKVIIKEQKRLLNLLNDSRDEISGEFKLGVIPTLSPYVLPIFTPYFIKAYPKVNLQIREMKTEDIISKLKTDEIDAGLLVTPLNEKNIEEKQLFYEPFYLFSNPKSNLAKKSKISQEDLDINEIWLLDKGNCFRDQVLNICNQSRNLKSSENIYFESGSLETLKNMVIKTHGYTILPYLAIKDLNAAQKKCVIPFKSPIPTREVSLVLSKDCLKHKIAGALEEEILGAIPDELRNFKRKSHEVIDIY